MSPTVSDPTTPGIPLEANLIITSFVLSLGIAVTIDGIQSGGFIEILPGLDGLSILNSTKSTVAIIPLIFLGGIAISRLSIQKCQRTLTNLFALGAITALVLAMIPDSDLGLNLEFWSGFGTIPTVLALVSAVGVCVHSYHGAFYARYRSIGNKVWLILPWACTILYLPIFIQPENGLLNFGDTSYHVVDEVLAPYSGRLPYSDYSPQYVGLWGWLIYPLKIFNLDAKSMMVAVIVLCNVFGLLLPLLSALILKRIYPRIRTVTLLATCLTTCFASSRLNGSSTILKEFGITGRLAPTLASLYFATFMTTSGHSKRLIYTVATGLTAAFSLLNNADIGLAFTGTLMIVTIVAAAFGNVTWRQVRVLGLSFTLATATYLALGLVSGRPFDIASYLGLRLENPRELYGSFSFHAFGAHLLLFGIAIAGLAFGLQGMFAANRIRINFPTAFISLVTSVFLIISLFRFSIRPIPAGVSSTAIIAFIPGAVLAIEGLKGFSASNIRLTLLQRFAVALFSTIPVGAFWQFSNPIDELRRISGNHVGESDWSSTPGRIVDGYSIEALSTPTDFMGEVESASRRIDPSSKIGYFGIHGHTVQLITGVQSVIGIPAPESLRFGKSQELLACKPITLNNVDFVIVYGTEFPCSDFVSDAALSNDRISVYRRL